MIRSLSLIPRKKFSTAAPKLIESLPGNVFHDKKFFEIEKQHLLGSSWQVLTHESLLMKGSETAPATYVADEVSGWPVIVVRSGRTGQLHGYHNVCRHKAGPLEWHETSGSCKLHGLACKYHGWTYSIDGKLKGLPLFGDSTNLDKSNYNLWPIRVANWRGLIFVQAIPPNVEDIPLNGKEADDLFVEENKEFCERLKNVPLENFTIHTQRQHDLKCNWKVYVENYLEGYHIPTIHEILNKQVVMKDYYVINHKGFVEHTVPPAEGANSAYEGLWCWHSPTMALNWYGNGLSIERIVPVSSETMKIKYLFLFDKNSDEASREHAMETSAEVTDEDIGICEAVQKNFSSGAYVKPGLLSPRHENGVAYFQQIIRDTYARAKIDY